MERIPPEFNRRGIRLRQIALHSTVRTGDRALSAPHAPSIATARDLDAVVQCFASKSENRLQSGSKSADHTSQTIPPSRFLTTPPSEAA